MAIELRAPCSSDLEALIDLQSAEAGTAPPLSPAGLASDLSDAARGHGAHVRVAVDAGVVAGAVGWVHGPGVMFASPYIAPRGEVAAALLDVVLAEARRAEPAWIRTSTGSLASPRAAVLAAAGFVRRFDFVDYARPTAGASAGATPVGARVVAFADLDRARLLELYNHTFEGVPNALPLSSEQLDEQLDAPLTFAAGTAALVDDAGAYVGFLHAHRLRDAAGEHVTVEAVGVAPGWRGRGVGAHLIERLLAAADADGVPEARALIASINPPSIALHGRLGFVERFRRHVWELLRGAPPSR